MALKSTVYKAELNITDLDRGYYASHSMTLALHPSETELRLMVRLLAFARHASERLAFTKGICADDEPDLWQKSLSDEIELWIDLGQPDEKRLRKACGRADAVWVYCYSGRPADVWWQQNGNAYARFGNLNVVNIPTEASSQLVTLCQRNMQLQVTLQDGQLWFADGEHNILVEPQLWRTAA